MNVYGRPLYYEIAFSFFDVVRQVDLIEEFAETFSGREVGRILDVCCGPSLQLQEFARRGYGVVGIDRNREMLRYLKNRTPEVETVRADMRRFRLKRRADLAVIMMGSIGQLLAANDCVASLNAVAESLNPGGLYLIENCRFFNPGAGVTTESWSARRGDVKVRAKWRSVMTDPAGQVFSDALTLDVDDHGRKMELHDDGPSRCYSAAQFEALVESTRRFDLVGWFERNRVRRLESDDSFNILVLRRK